MSQSEEIFLEGNVVSSLALPFKNSVGFNFDSYSSTLGHQNTIIFIRAEIWIFSTRFQENMFCLQFLAQLKISGTETWILRQNLKETYIIFNFGPHPGKKMTFAKFEQDIVYLQLWAPLKIKMFSDVQTGILCDKIWKENNLASALGPTKNCGFWWGSNW